MDFEWDNNKNNANYKKHGIRFEEAKLIFNSPVFTVLDPRSDDYGEVRELSIGTIDIAVVITVVHTDRDGKTRLISARRANRQERKIYYDYLEKTLS